MWLFSDVSCTVIRIAENVLTTIRQCVRESEQRFEVGGILLGKRIGRELQIEAATVPLNFQDCRRGSFRLDGEEASQCCRRLMGHSPELCVAGLWHSHLYGIAEFSEQDIQVNHWFADQFGKSAAVLVTQKEQNLLFRICELEEPAKMRSGGHYEREYFEVRSI